MCVAGTFQDQTGQTSCKNCVAGSYSASAGQDNCEACRRGNTSNAKSTSCDENCSNKSNVSQWETATWNTNNTVSNSCKIKACNSNYKIENNKCVPKIVNCPAGYYIAANTTECIKCPANYKCEGGPLNPGPHDVGKTPCGSNQVSPAGSTECYNKSGTVPGSNIFGWDDWQHNKHSLDNNDSY